MVIRKRQRSRNPQSPLSKEGKPEPVIAKISQETLAEMIGTTRSRVSSFMNKFRQLGFIDYNGKLEVHSSLLNVVLHDEPHITT
jgi:CRP/FNR family cyclic AMP-dependent transcriptional regulator